LNENNSFPSSIYTIFLPLLQARTSLGFPYKIILTWQR